MSERRPRIDHLNWDAWNRERIAKHDVTPSEVEQVIAGDVYVKETYKARFMVTGPTIAKRMLSVVVGAVPNMPGVFYVFSARPASRKERADYGRHKGAS